MFAYATRRIIFTIPLVLIASFAIFALTANAGDPRDRLATCATCDQTAFDRMVSLYELDKSVPERYISWLGDAVTGDLGTALHLGERPVNEIFWQRLKNTAKLAVPAFGLIALVAISLGVYSAIRQYSPGDYTITGFSFFGLSMPTFFFGLLLQVIMVVWWQGWTGTKPFYSAGMHDGEFLASATLPIITLMLVIVAGESRFERAAMLEVINADYIRTARAKGLPERTVIFKHALRNAMIPLVTIWAIDFAALLGGSVITETVFAWPGLGNILIPAIFNLDLDLVMAITMFAGVLVVAFNLLADLLYGILDPRIRYD